MPENITFLIDKLTQMRQLCEHLDKHWKEEKERVRSLEAQLSLVRKLWYHGGTFKYEDGYELDCDSIEDSMHGDDVEIQILKDKMEEALHDA